MGTRRQPGDGRRGHGRRLERRRYSYCVNTSNDVLEKKIVV